MGCLYQIEFPNGKSYIGITKYDAEKRFAGHCEGAAKGRNLILHNAIRKHGKENCKIRTLVIANDAEYLKDLEIKAIATFNTRHPNGYNSTRGGDGMLGLAEEVEATRVQKIKEKWQDPEYKKKKSETTKKQFQDEEKKERHSKGLKKYWARDLYAKDKARENYKKGLENNPDMIEKMRDSLKKYWSDFEKRKSWSDKRKEYYTDPVAIQKNIASQKLAYTDPKLQAKMKMVRKKQWKNPESIKKLSDSQKKRFASLTKEERAEYGRKISEKLKGRKHSDETKKKISEAAKKRYLSNEARVKTGRAIAKAHREKNVGK